MDWIPNRQADLLCSHPALQDLTKHENTVTTYISSHVTPHLVSVQNPSLNCKDRMKPMFDIRFARSNILMVANSSRVYPLISTRSLLFTLAQIAGNFILRAVLHPPSSESNVRFFLRATRASVDWCSCAIPLPEAELCPRNPDMVFLKLLYMQGFSKPDNVIKKKRQKKKHNRSS